MAAAMTVALALTVIIIRQVAQQASESSIARQLEAAKSSIGDLLNARSARLRDVSRTLVPLPQYLSRVTEALRQQDRANLQDQADEFRNQIRADWVLLTDADGVLWSWTLHPELAGEDMRAGSLIGVALDGVPTEGVWIEPSDSGLTLYQAVGVPLSASGERPAGVLVAAVAIDSAFADTLARNTAGEVVFFVEDSAGKVRPVTSSRGAGDALADVGQLRSVVDTLGHKHLGGRWEGAVGALTTADGTPAAGYVGLRSIEAELAPYARLERTVWLAFIVGIMLILLASVFVTRQVTRPVITLASVTRRVADGDYSAEISRAGDDEIGDLARSFAQMLEDLREKERLVEFLASGANHAATSTSRTDLPVALSSSGPTNFATLDSLTGSASAPVPGDVLGGRYEVLDVVGEGGMGVVYRVRDRELDEVVALKMLRSDAAFEDMHVAERFKREIVLARRITHRNVVRTYDLGEHRGALFITMEYVEGASLDELIQGRGRLPVDVTISIGRQLCRALEIAHEAGVIHRDIKPHNIIVQGDGFVKVMDFGIARVSDRPAKTGLTQAGAMLGTPGYMPPEQLLGEELDSRADVYAVGAVLFECLTGRPPYEAPNTMALMARVLEGDVPDPRDFEPDVPPPIAAAIKRSLEKDRNARFATAREMRTALEMSGMRLSTV